MKQGEKISSLENASQNLIHVSFDHLQKDFEKNLQKNLQKKSGASVVQNFKYEESIHAYLMRIYIGSILSNLCTYNYALLYLLWFVLASITKKGEIEREIGLHLFLN